MRHTKPITFFVAVVVAISAACNGGPSPPTSPPSTPPTTPPGGEITTGRVVNAVDMNQGIASASIQSDGLAAVTSDTSGHFSVQSSSATGQRSFRISAPSIIERSVFFKVPGDHITVSTMPASIELSYFNEMVRNTFGGLTRWTSAPVLVVERSAIEYGSRVSTGETVPEEVVQRTIAEVRQTLAIVSAGRYMDFASIEVRDTAAGMTSQIPNGAIGLTWQTRLLEGFMHVAYGSRSYGGPTAGLTRGEVALDRDWHVHGLPAGSRRDFFFVVQHELGHAMGYSHTKFAPSFMYEVFLMTISTIDRQVFEIVMQRPNGNLSPDTDPATSPLNLVSGGHQTIVERCNFLRR